jgi:amino acid transporter
MSSLFTAVAITLLLLFQIFYYGSYSGFAIGAIIVFYVLGFYSLPRYLAINKVLKRYEKENPKKIDRVVSS